MVFTSEVQSPHHAWRDYAVALFIIGVASATRLAFFADLGRSTAYLTYYPAVVLAALYGGLRAGALATVVSALLCFYWIQRGYMSAVESLAMAVFLLSCLMISGIAEAMRRAEARAKQAMERAEAANNAKSVFLASMSHELRTPLNAILGFTEIMRRDEGVPVEQRKTLDIINRSGEHLLTLINAVLDMAKIDAGQMKLEIAACDVASMGREVVELMQPSAAQKKLQLRFDESPGCPRWVQADEAKLRQVLVNLLGNAVKFTEQGGVTLRLGSEPGDTPRQRRLVVEVEDSGIGIAEADQERIYQPFVQVGDSAQHKGTGLGLAITQKSVELMGGHMSVQSRPGEGSLFRLDIPVEPVSAPALAPSLSGNGDQILGPAPGQPGYRLLIVEDQMENWMLLQHLLEPVGWEVRVAENGQAGVEMFESWHPDLIWMDIRMPVMDGLEATRKIRALEGGREVKIIAVTASVFKQESEAVLAAGMDELIRKPYRPAEIYDCLSRQLGVSFISRQDALAEVALPAQPALRAELVASLPESLRRDLCEALIALDVARVGELIGRAGELNPELGKGLEHHAAQFGYSVILRALQPGAETRAGMPALS